MLIRQIWTMENLHGKGKEGGNCQQMPLSQIGTVEKCQQRENGLEIAGKCLLVKLGPWKNCRQWENVLEIAGKCFLAKFGHSKN